jgi:hypothetical protein
MSSYAHNSKNEILEDFYFLYRRNKRKTKEVFQENKTKMGDYKFVIYEKLDGDAHTDRMLQEDHGNVPEEITNKQLESHHVGYKDTIMEDLLEKNRTGSAEVVLEKNLNDSKDQFGSQHRNPSAYEGDISKLEEQRIANNKKNEEYEVASETPKRSRWWELKTKDGLKIASKKEAQFHYDDINWEELDRQQDDEFASGDVDDDLMNDLSNDFSVDDIGFEVDELDKKIPSVLKEVSFDVPDVGGTPTAKGEIQISNLDFYDSANDPRLEEDLKDVLDDISYREKVELPFNLSSFDFSKFSEGVISFAMETQGTQGFEIDDLTASNNFPVVEASKKK